MGDKLENWINRNIFGMRTPAEYSPLYSVLIGRPPDYENSRLWRLVPERFRDNIFLCTGSRGTHFTWEDAQRAADHLNLGYTEDPELECFAFPWAILDPDQSYPHILLAGDIEWVET